ncbi:peroxidase family protein [Methyloglobulus sp.]|uniref:peroxidase family protein n=1 Tax=Methyloglobulus sp. TaxID=2518622 RepID=UPI0032B751CA
MLAKTSHCLAEKRRQPLQTLLLATVIAMSNVGVDTSQAAINTSDVGAGFTVSAADLSFILKQIKIAEFHAANTTSETGLCGALVGDGPNQISSTLLSFGLRTVDGSCNNLEQGQTKFGAADQVFPRLTVPNFNKQAEDSGVFGPPGLTSYNQTSGAVVDSQPRMISNLIVDQTSTNLAAAYVYLNPPRAQGGAPIVLPCDSNGLPSGCEVVPDFETLLIPNVTTDVGLSPPFNSLFTIFGQFFDHGLDKINNGGNGAVFVPLKADDPLIAGPDHILGAPGCSEADPVTCDDLPLSKRFMVLTRGTIVPPSCSDPTNPNCYRGTVNSDSPFVDQSQTYTSHSSHQVLLREYTMVAGPDNLLGTADDRPVATGKFLSEPAPVGGIAKWSTVKAEVADKLGLQLVDADVNNIPMIAADPYGNFIPGPARGLPQFVTNNGTGLLEGNIANPVPAPVDVVRRINTAFLNDIAHSAAPTFHLDCSALPPGSPPNTPCLNSGDPLIGTLFPDNDNLVGSSLATADPPGSYDDELLDEHFICGDGRCNENIALIAVHQIFHMEHDRLVDYNAAVLALPENAALLADFNAIVPSGLNKTFTFGERMFQAARFVTEMQYQHLVFEEFARKVQPAINPFEAFAFNQTDVNSAITAEFAHSVYRFGHSMLTETLPRPQLRDANGDPIIPGTPLDNEIGLLKGFLNPVEFYNSGNPDIKLDAHQATGQLIMGLSDQVGNEIDEFVTDTLRNNLLGLPLDLPSLNMMRARSEGVPSLNNVRKQIFAATNDGQLAPYSNWIDFDQAIKHHASLVNFIAAYGKHPSILFASAGPDNDFSTVDDNEPATLASRRAAAGLIVNGTTIPDAAEFMFSTGAWANVGGVSQTGVDDIDLWMGGLAENTNVFGGLLGPTFNYVFEKQMTDLQNGDRFYYLARTPGMNLRAQLEGNSFAELVLRNTNPYTHTLKADPFATADCKFELGRLTWPAVLGSAIVGVGSVNDDPLTECNENLLLLRSPNGRIQYRSTNSVDPPGINGQAVYNGTDFADNFYGGNDNDTFWGGLDNDRIEGGGGDDVVLGGEGDDIITDTSGDDFIKGGPGNDAIDGGIGLDIIIAGDGKDFTNGGGNINETFLGAGDDFAIAGQGTDAVFGDSGDDWEEGGDQPDLLIGDSSSLFFDDHNLPGHDILIGQGGDDDYDMEGGDDIGVAGPGVEKNAGGAGWDWLIGLNDPQAQNMDLNLNLVGVPLPANAVRDRFNEVEALSGWNLNDTLRGDDAIPSAVGGLAGAGGFIGCDALDADGVARIAGLELLVTPAMRVVDPQPITDAASTYFCGLEAEPTFAGLGTPGGVWGEGNILLGGAGSDTLEGRGANDILDGDKYLNVRLSVHAPVVNLAGDVINDGSGALLGSTGLMETVASSGNFGAGTEGMTLQAAVFAGKVNPGNIVAVREILRPIIVTPDCANPVVANRVNCDKALFSGPANEYTVIGNADGSVTVTDNADPTAAAPIVPAVPRSTDGIDTLWNMEQLSFCQVPGAVRGTCTTRGPVVSITPTVATTGTFGFPNQVVNTTSVARTVTVRNSGVASLVLNSVAISGANAALFTRTGGTCTTGTTLLKNGTCTVSATFRPDSSGSKAASVVIVHNGVGLVTNLAMSGTGTAPVASLSESAFDFGSTQTAAAAGTGPTRDFILSNSGTAPLTINSVVLNGSLGAGFSRVGGFVGNCGAALGANGATCIIRVRFQPTTGGLKTGTLTVTDNSNAIPNSQQVVILSGNATITAANDALNALASGAGGVQNISFNVRGNDAPNNAGTVTINSSSFTNGTATATAIVTGAGNNVVTWQLTGVGGTNEARRLSRVGTYTVNYTLTNGGATAQATYTMTVN